VFELLLWSIEQVQEYQAPTYEFAVSVLQTISQVRPFLASKGTMQQRCLQPENMLTLGARSTSGSDSSSLAATASQFQSNIIRGV
jgi:hypothetical protein